MSEQTDPQAPAREQMGHLRSCPQLSECSDDTCTCGLEWRIRLATEQEMHAAWRKRADEAEAALASLRAEHARLTEERDRNRRELGSAGRLIESQATQLEAAESREAALREALAEFTESARRLREAEPNAFYAMVDRHRKKFEELLSAAPTGSAPTQEKRAMAKTYWFRSDKGFAVTYHLLRQISATWTRVYGFQIGDWFIGAVRGRVSTPTKEGRTR